MVSLRNIIKYNPLSASIYGKLMEARSRDVKAYIFVAKTGRSGSDSLSRIFEAANNAVCLHEPYPIMLNDFEYRGDREAYFKKLFRRIKRINIRRTAAGHNYYVETNHLFIQNIIAPAIEYFGDKIRIINLIRDPVKVSSSYYKIESIPGETPRGKHYLINPKNEKNLIKISDLLYGNKEYEHDLYKCIWYWYEIQARVKKWKLEFPNICWLTMNTEDMNNKASLIEMFDKLKVEYDLSKLDKLVGSRVNLKTEMKKKSIESNEATEMHQKLLAVMEKRFGQNFWL